MLSNENIEYIFTGKNLGYGAAHNIAIRKAMERGSRYHAVLNPDVEFESSVIDRLAQRLDQDPAVALAMPKIFSREGELQYLCKLLPTPSDLIFKRFFPFAYSKNKAERFQLKFADYDKEMNVPYLSGCFMFLRVEALREVGLFDERFFMYPEDIDLTRRLHERYQTLYCPTVSIVHAHSAASYKSKKMLVIHIVNMIRYFCKWGWFFDSQRTKTNRECLQRIRREQGGR